MMSRMGNEVLFHQPTQEMLEKGLKCEDHECKGQYQRKTRDMTIKQGKKSISIQDSEYWECDVCGAFLTSKEENRRIKKLIKEHRQFNGRLTLRLSPELHQQLVEEAEKNHRSINNELTYRLEQSLKKTGS